MKKILALVLAMCMVFALCACGSSAPAASTAPAANDAPAADAGVDAIPDEMTSDNGKYDVAFVTDVGQLKDKSFNQGTFDGVKTFAVDNGLTYKYYQPANGNEATDDDRYDAMKAAAENGASIVVCAGFLQNSALVRAADEFPEVKFIFIDGWSERDNIAGIAFKEEQCGYLAGYAVVKDGYTKLGFCGGGGGDNPACCRYGYGFVQGVDAAAKEMGVNVDVNYSWLYGASFSASPELQTLASSWYEQGTEAIFACGGTMFDSIAAAASANDGAVIGVDKDQSFDSDTVITSALKGITEATIWACEKANSDAWSEIGGQAVSLGAVENAVGLPTATWSLEGWTVEEYETMLAGIVDGSVAIDNDYANLAGTENVALNIVE